jgi:predicted TIM-barrel fold metal-dependent hydrolase
MGHRVTSERSARAAHAGNSNGLVFSTDFPHGDSKFPESMDRFLQLDISEADKRQILWDNCAAYYGITG